MTWASSAEMRARFNRLASVRLCPASQGVDAEKGPQPENEKHGQADPRKTQIYPGPQALQDLRNRFLIDG